ncbi:putative Regulatory protein ArsR [Vibrio tapetis subsp. tapetis]|uniref:Putative Regulatory protein ArsR n=2 Tax=Vibrio tapetis TaxID=52443 RepID=A0A2N8ZKP3_9VIBR|nr:putative Regulatory protein ArsR [Vibrio tapetis subsp. tapetis]
MLEGCFWLSVNILPVNNHDFVMVNLTRFRERASFYCMNLNDKTPLSDIFMALSDETRRSMVAQMSQGAVAVKDLVLPHPISKSAVTKHLKILERAGLLKREVIGRTHMCSLNVEPINQINQWLAMAQPVWDDTEEALQFYMDVQLTE